jgi:hypothetical protein
MVRDLKFYLFFTSTANGRRAARAFLKGWERKTGRDKAAPSALPPAEGDEAGATGAPGSARIQIPVLIVNGDNDIMVLTVNSIDMA